MLWDKRRSRFLRFPGSLAALESGCVFTIARYASRWPYSTQSDWADQSVACI
jgi:hypothetical protein